MCNPLVGNPLAVRQCDEVKQAKGQDSSEFQFLTCSDTLKAENGVGNSARLSGQRRIGPALSQHRLHGRTVDECELYCFFLSDHRSQEFRGSLLAVVTLLVGLCKTQTASSEVPGLSVGLLQGLFKIDGRTSGQNGDGCE